MSEDFFDQTKEFLPRYLIEDRKEANGFLNEIKKFPTNQYYSSTSIDSKFLQGDGYRNFPIFNFKTKEVKDVKGLILSNSCDISLENARNLPVYLLFCPLVALDKLEALLKRKSKSDEVWKSKIQSIKAQQITDMFYLPRQTGTVLDQDYVAMFSQISNIPISYCEEKIGDRLFTLNQIGFYLLTIKLSIHFCRLHEGVFRGN